MNSPKSFLIFVCVLFFTNSYSQTGPGGVGTNDGASKLDLWLDASVGVEEAVSDPAENNDNITYWRDQSGNTIDAQQLTVNDKPNYNTTGIGGQPSINFTSANTEVLTATYTFQEDLHIFVVATSSNANWNNYGFINSARGANGIIVHPRSGSRTLQFYNVDNTSGYLLLGSVTPTNITLPNIYDLGMDHNTGTVNYDIGLNGSSSTATATDTRASSSQTLYMGRDNCCGSRYMNGQIGEIIYFNEKLNAAEDIIVNNYLAAKYGIALSANDLYDEDNAGNGNYDHDVAGIGQATDGTNHTDSQGNGIVRMNTPSALSNGDYLFWGEATKNPTYNFSAKPANYAQELNSKWRVSKTGDLGTVTVSFDISSMDLTGKLSCASLQLIVDDNDNFLTPSNVYNLNISGSTASVTGVSFSDNDYFSLSYGDEIVWDGAKYLNGSGIARAPDTTDECLKLTIKPGTDATLSDDAHVREVEVEAGATLNVEDGELLEVEDKVIIDGIIDLLGEAQLIQNHNTTTSNSGSGTLNIRQQGASNLYNYNYWSSPVNIGGSWQIGNLEDAAGVVQFQSGPNADASTSPITLSSRWLYEFNGLSDNYFYWKKLTTSTNLLPGIGFTMKGSSAATANQEYIFKGIPNDGNYTYAVTAGNDFLVGNPYPSALDAEQFIIDNAGVIDGTLYFWEHFTSNNSHFLIDYEGGYATYTSMMGVPAVADASGLTSGNGSASLAAPTQNITVGQGFFVTIENTGNLVFNNGQRFFARESLSETIFYKNRTKKKAVSGDQRTKIWFSFKEPNNRNRIFGLGYDINATNGYDNRYDAKTYEVQRNDINWRLGDEKLIIQALPEININDELPLDVKVTDTGIYKFSIDRMQNFPDATEVYLKDNNENVYYNLKNGDVEVLLNATGYYNEFSIVFKKDTTLGTTVSENENFFTAYDAKTKQIVLLNIDNLNDIKSLNIYNTLGQQIISLKSINSNRINVSNLSNGIYILKLNNKNAKNFMSSKFAKH